MTIEGVLNPTKALRTLHKTLVMLERLLTGMSQQQAQALRDGEDGWSVLFIACHLRDFEAIFTQRV